MWVPDSYQLSTSQSETSDRPRFEIPKEQLEYFLEHELTIPDVAQALGVSVSTVKRRLRDHGISVADKRSTIADCDLDNQVRDIRRLFPNAGYRRTRSQLSLRGIIVPESRVRESMQRIDRLVLNSSQSLSIATQTLSPYKIPVSIFFLVYFFYLHILVLQLHKEFF